MKRLLLATLSLSLSLSSFAQDTFSIVAVDPATGEIGSAGASCIANCKIISLIVPEIGVVHIQAQFVQGNKQNALSFMDGVNTPQQVLRLLTQYDNGGDSTIRQYGIAMLKDGQALAAGYTGDSCMDYKNHIVGPNYSIQGNILLGQQVLDSMQARFLREPGPLHYKLMAALQGANIPGADSRCLGDNKPAISAFIRLYQPGDDTLKKYFMDLNVSNTTGSNNPIDSLQKLFTKTTTGIASRPTAAITIQVRPNPAKDMVSIRFYTQKYEKAILKIYDLTGREVYTESLTEPHNQFELNTSTWQKGAYFYHITAAEASGSGKLMIN